MNTIQHLRSIIEWPYRAILRGESQLDHIVNIFPFFSLFNFIKSVRSNRFHTGTTTLSIPPLSNDPIFTLYRLKLTVDELGDTGHVSDNASFHEAIDESYSFTDVLIQEDIVPRDLDDSKLECSSEISHNNQSKLPVTKGLVINDLSLEIEIQNSSEANLDEISPVLNQDSEHQQPMFETLNASDVDLLQTIALADEETKTDINISPESKSEQTSHNNIDINTLDPALINLQNERWTIIEVYKSSNYKKQAFKAPKYMHDTTKITISPYLKWLRSTIPRKEKESQNVIVGREKKKSDKKLALEAVIENSITDHNFLITEQYAELLYTQGYLERSKNIYLKLIERFPEKSAIFASKIEQINKEII